MGKIEEDICEAISILVDKAVSQAEYDKTIEATIIELVDGTIGKHKIRYQNSTFYAYSNSPDISYSKGTSVYVLVPKNDMSNEKTIIGAVDKLGSDFIKTPNRDEAYETIGNNIITDKNIFNLCSYKNGTEVILYDKNRSTNQLNINVATATEYLRQSGSIICGATFKTQLPLEQQYRGNYGITFALDFVDHTGNDKIITRSYTVDINEMTGTPYTYTKPSRQYGIFDIDALNFIEINHISIFCYDFPNENNVKPDDIFVSNIELNGALKLTDEDIQGIVLSINTPDGSFFGNGCSLTTLPLQAELKVKGKVLDNNSQKVNYYWFSENVTITSSSMSYNKYGGQGWRCLNNSNVIRPATSVTDPVVEWIPHGNEFTINKADVIAKEVVYKCIAIYAGNVISQEIEIRNYDSKFDIKIKSDKGTQFYYDVGLPSLTCLVNGTDLPTGQYNYHWIWMDQSNSYVALEETTAYNTEYNTALANYNTLLGKIQREEILQAAAQGQLNNYKKIINKYDETTTDSNDEVVYPLARVEKNKIFKINVNKISKLRTFKCAVTNTQGQFIGNGIITLYNILNLEGIYTLVINNGTQIFNYTENGVTPMSDSLETPQDIQTLSFDIYDNYGNQLGRDILKNCDIQWIVPTKRTLLSIPDTYKPESVNESKGEAIYSGQLTLSYNIDDKYSLYKTANNIKLLVTYQGMSLTAQTAFTFTKDGTLGENGTEFAFKIIPNIKTGTQEPPYPSIIGGSLNFTPANTTEWFVLQLWHNGYEVFKSFKSGTSDEGKQVSLSWEILKNKYNYSTYDATVINVSNNSGFSLVSSFTPGMTVANVIKCNIKYDGITYYATLPLILGWKTSGYEITLAENSGFHYVTYTSDGRRPQYDNANPFEIEVLRNVNGYWEDVSLLTSENYSISYTWDTAGRTLIAGSTSWKESEQLIEVNDKSLQKNQKYFKPADHYDGYCVSNAVICDMYCKGKRIGYLYIPIHMMLNKNGIATLEGWDGNSIDIDDKGGIILSPQVGAGKKETDNTFTGMLMGLIKESGKTIDEIGLFGFNHGIRTLFIDSEDGSSIFGKPGDGQIVLDPASQKALIYSPSYWKTYDQKGKPTSYGSTNENKQGLLIDLTTPEIRYGSGNFVVSKEGYTTIKGGGEIAGWLITDHTIHNKKVDNYVDEKYTGLNSVSFNAPQDQNGVNTVKNMGGETVMIMTSALSDVKKYQSIAYWAGGKPSDGLASYAKFYITHEGFLHATAAQFSLPNASLAQSLFMGKTVVNGVNSFGIFSGTKPNANYADEGFYIGTTGIGLGIADGGFGSAFYINEQGTGRIAGWNVDKVRFRSETTGYGYIELLKEGIIRNNSGYWSIYQNGTAIFDNIGDSSSLQMWNIDTNGNFYGRALQQKTTNTDVVPHWWVTAAGEAYFDSIGDGGQDANRWSIDTKGNTRVNSIKQYHYDPPTWYIDENGKAGLDSLEVWSIKQRGDSPYPFWIIDSSGKISCKELESINDSKIWNIHSDGSASFYSLYSYPPNQWEITPTAGKFVAIGSINSQQMWKIDSGGNAEVLSLKSSYSSYHWEIKSNGEGVFNSLTDLMSGSKWKITAAGEGQFTNIKGAGSSAGKFEIMSTGKIKFDSLESYSQNFSVETDGTLKINKMKDNYGASWEDGELKSIVAINPGGDGTFYISRLGNGYFNSVHSMGGGPWEITQSGIAKFTKITNNGSPIKLKVTIPAGTVLTGCVANERTDDGAIKSLTREKEKVECIVEWENGIF